MKNLETEKEIFRGELSCTYRDFSSFRTKSARLKKRTPIYDMNPVSWTKRNEVFI